MRTIALGAFFGLDIVQCGLVLSSDYLGRSLESLPRRKTGEEVAAKKTSPTTMLILGAAAVQNDAVISAQRLGVNVIVAAQTADGPAAKNADEFVGVNFMVLDGMRELIRTREVDVVYSTGSDLAMPIAMALSEEFGLPHFVSKETAVTCNNKVEMRELTKDLPGAVGFARYTFDNAGNHLTDLPSNLPGDGPWIVKPADAQGQRGIKLVKDKADIPVVALDASKFSRTNSAIAEEYIGGTEVSVNGYLIDGEIQFLVVSDRETWPEFTGLIRAHHVPSIYTDNPVVFSRMNEVISKFSRRLGISNGPVYAQVKIADGDVRMIEITPRLDGCHMWHLLSHVTPVNLMDVTLRHLLFQEKPKFPSELSLASGTLEFLCQAPDTPAKYPEGYAQEGFIGAADKHKLAGTRYYSAGQNVRPVNGRFEKIGYEIFADTDAQTTKPTS